MCVLFFWNGKVDKVASHRFKICCLRCRVAFKLWQTPYWVEVSLVFWEIVDMFEGYLQVDEMGSRIDELEKSIDELMEQTGVKEGGDVVETGEVTSRGE